MVIAGVDLHVPIDNGNYTAITFNCTTNTTSTAGNYNATIYYNASGGPVSNLATKLGTLTNDTATETDITGSLSIEALTDGSLYNFTCYVSNGTATGINLSSTGYPVIIDNTNPTGSVVFVKSKLNTNRVQEVTWTSADATSGLTTTTLTLTSPNSDKCATFTSTDSSGVSQYLTTSCVGTYTTSFVVTDSAGNSETFSETFKVEDAGAGWPSGDSITTDLSTTIQKPGPNKALILIVIIVAVIIFFRTKKK